MIHSYLNMARPVQGFPIQDSSAARSTDWIGLKDYEGVVFLLQAEVGAAADDITVTLRQARTAAGAGAKALTPRRWYRLQAADLAADAAPDFPTELTGASAVIEGNNANLLYVEVDASELDVSNRFAYVQLQTDNGGAAGKLIGCTAWAVGPSYANDPAKLANPLD